MANITLRPTETLDDYIRQIETAEKERKRRRVFYIAGLVLGLTSLAVTPLVFMKRGSVSLRQFPAETMSIFTIDSLLEKDKSPIVLTYADGRVSDTITRVSDFVRISEGDGGTQNVSYNTFSQDYPEAGLGTDVVDVTVQSDGENTPPAENTEAAPVTRIQPFAFAVEGERRVGQSLNLTVIDYDENINYTLDMGNGDRKQIQRRLSYTYSAPGLYQVQLVARNSSGASSVYRRSIEVSETAPAATNQQQASTAPASAVRPQSITIAPISGAPERSNALPSVSASPVTAAPALRPAVSENNAGPLYSADVMPSYPGGDAAMRSFIQQNLTYPEEALERGIQGKVLVRFVVQPDGSMTNVQVVKGLGAGTDEEAIRVVRSMGKWTPGTHEGRTVPVYKSIMISFVYVK
ncbi:MAG: TonB family protein [Bacteroidetes bacterium]|nr:MAG: TonB family protein [Bacteroidota bacterium]